jgi:hypothetical protein
MEIVQDTVTVQLSAEKSIPTETVKVSAAIILSVTAAEAGDVRSTITSKLKGILDAEWSLTALNRRPDASGREQVEAAAVARVPESEAAGFAHKCKQASVEGFQVSAGVIDYSPPRNVVNDAKIELRKELYQLAANEAEAIQAVLASGEADRGWRVADITFNDVQPVAMNNIRGAKGLESTAYAMSNSLVGAAPGGGGGEVGLTQKVSLYATVTLARVVVNPVD